MAFVTRLHFLMANNEVVPSIEFVWLYMATWNFPPFVSSLLSGFAFWYWIWYRITTKLTSYQPSNNCGYWYVAHIKLSTHYIPVYRISAVLVLCLSFSEGTLVQEVFASPLVRAFGAPDSEKTSGTRVQWRQFFWETESCLNFNWKLVCR